MGFLWLCKTKIWWKSNIVLYISLYTHKTNDIYKGILEYVETEFDISSYELDRPLPKGRNKKLIGLIQKQIMWKNHELKNC